MKIHFRESLLHNQGSFFMGWANAYKNMAWKPNPSFSYPSFDMLKHTGASLFFFSGKLKCCLVVYLSGPLGIFAWAPVCYQSSADWHAMTGVLLSLLELKAKLKFLMKYIIPLKGPQCFQRHCVALKCCTWFKKYTCRPLATPPKLTLKLPL